MLLNQALRITHYALRTTLKRSIAWRYRIWPPDFTRTYQARVAGMKLEVLPDVFHPGWYFTSAFMAKALLRGDLVPVGARVLDVGTGSGVLALAAAERAGEVVAVDINPAAVRCARDNAARLGFNAKMAVREGDMFAPVGGARFDLILCNPPYFRGQPTNWHERAFFGGPGLEWLQRFAAGAHEHLAPGGKLLLVLGDAAEVDTILDIFVAAGWWSRVVARRNLLHEVILLFELRREGRGK